jgi:hypothetical protein
MDGELSGNVDLTASFGVVGERTIRNGEREQGKEDDTVSLTFSSAYRRSEV